MTTAQFISILVGCGYAVSVAYHFIQEWRLGKKAAAISVLTTAIEGSPDGKAMVAEAVETLPAVAAEIDADLKRKGWLGASQAQAEGDVQP